jgi:hypothetical protein
MRGQWERLAHVLAKLALALGLVAVPSVHAQSSIDFTLTLEGDASCSSAPALQDAIEARVGGLVFTDDPRAARRIRVQVIEPVPSAPGSAPDSALEWSAVIAMRDARDRVVGERRVSAVGASCAALDEALIVVITTMIGIADPTASVAPPAPLPEPEPKPEGKKPPAPAVPEPEAEPLRSDIHLALVARAELGFLPGLAPGAALAVGFDLGAAVLSIGGSFLPYAQEDLGTGARAHFMSGTGEASLCLEAGHPFGASFDFCAGVEAGVISARTTGLYAGAARVDPVVRANIGARLRAPLSPDLGLLVSLQAAAPLAFPRYFFIEAGGARRYYHAVELGIATQIGIYWIFSS